MTMRAEANGRGPRRRASLVTASAVAVAGATLLVGAAGVAMAAPPAPNRTTVYGNTPSCSVVLHLVPAAHPTSVEVTVLSGCTTGTYYLSSWSAPSDIERYSRPQQLFAQTSTAPYVVGLPACYWQVDFGERSAPFGQAATSRTLIAAELGGTGCTSSSSTTTTIATTTTTTVPSNNGSPSTTTSTSTSLPPTASTTTIVPVTAPPGGSTPPGGGPGPITTQTVPAVALSESAPPVAVPATPTDATGTLPFTGSDTALLLLGAVVAIAGGSAFVVGGKARRRHG